MILYIFFPENRNQLSSPHDHRFRFLQAYKSFLWVWTMKKFMFLKISIDTCMNWPQLSLNMNE